MPAEDTEALENLAFDLAQEASELSGQLHPIVRLSVADLVRSMNCYYSNLIEGHNTHPRDIDRALAEDYSADPRRRDLQLEARAHIEVLSALASYHVYEAERTSIDYGSEVNAQLQAKWKRFTGIVKYADYDADDLFTDTTKFWVQLQYVW